MKQTTQWENASPRSRFGEYMIQERKDTKEIDNFIQKK